MSALRPFLDLRQRAAAERIGDGGLDTCTALTDGLDTALRDLASGIGTGASVVALGGYGRREQCLWSDVDIMLLHQRSNPEPLVRTILYPLWDANLKVGHSVRTLDESRKAGLEQFETLTSLLSARLVAGDDDLFAQLLATVADLIRTRPLTSRLADQERERRNVDPYPTMAADLKEGRGALRTHQGFWWERRRAELIGLDPDQSLPEEAQARRTLLSIRNALHAAARRPSDQFVAGLREPAAAWLDTDVYSLAASLTAALDAGDRVADRRWPDLHAERDPMIRFGRRVFGAIRSRFSASEHDIPEGQSSVPQMAVAAAARKSGAWFAPAEEATIRRAPPAAWTPADRTAFVTLLSGGARGRTIFGRLTELGWVDREFPEWGPVATAPQLAPFHDHPVGAHLWRTVNEMHRLITGEGTLRAIAEEVGSTEELLLAAFLHDIGKARGGDHEIVGAALADGFLRRVGFGPATTGVVVDAVRQHLLLSETATRRDIGDLEVIDEVAARVGDIHRLRVLYLLTIADLRATGTTMWNEWRATLLERLYVRAASALQRGGAVSATPNIEAIMDAADPGVERRAVEEHIAAMPPEYLDAATPDEVLWNLEAVARLDGPALVSTDPEDAGRILIVGRDRSGFLLAVARTFAAHGIEVMDARLRTRSDGIALDTFHVRDDRTGSPIPPERWDRVLAGLLDSLVDQYALRPAVRKRVHAYRPPNHDADAVEVRGDQAGRFTAIEVRAPDRIGLLADVVEAFSDEGLDVHLARIDTMGGRARDLFYVRRVGVPVRVESELVALVGRLRDRLRG